MWTSTKKLMFLLLIPLLTAKHCYGLGSEAPQSKQKHVPKQKNNKAIGQPVAQLPLKKGQTQNRQTQPAVQRSKAQAIAIDIDQPTDADDRQYVEEEDSYKGNSSQDDRDGKRNNQDERSTETPKKKGIIEVFKEWWRGGKDKQKKPKQDKPEKDNNSENLYERIVDDMVNKPI